jgi:hypothetical protein
MADWSVVMDSFRIMESVLLAHTDLSGQVLYVNIPLRVKVNLLLRILPALFEQSISPTKEQSKLISKQLRQSSNHTTILLDLNIEIS